MNHGIGSPFDEPPCKTYVEGRMPAMSGIKVMLRYGELQQCLYRMVSEAYAKSKHSSEEINKAPMIVDSRYPWKKADGLRYEAVCFENDDPGMDFTVQAMNKLYPVTVLANRKVNSASRQREKTAPKGWIKIQTNVNVNVYKGSEIVVARRYERFWTPFSDLRAKLGKAGTNGDSAIWDLTTYTYEAFYRKVWKKDLSSCGDYRGRGSTPAMVSREATQEAMARGIIKELDEREKKNTEKLEALFAALKAEIEQVKKTG